MKIDYDKLQGILDRNMRQDIVQEKLRKFAPDHPPHLSDIYVNRNRGGQSYLIGLEEQEKREMRPGGKPFKWKILVLRDEWGNVPQPGDVITRVVPINRKNRDKHPVRARDLDAAKMDGSFSDRYEQRNEYLVDEKGCIECTFSDAGYFLFNWGVHFRTKRGMTTKPELSKEPVKTRDGDMMHVWYWRYAEVTDEEHENLPERTIDKATKKRGEK